MKDELVQREDRIQEAGRLLGEAFEAIQQPRSDFALAHFVVAQHDTPARQWAQAVLELQIKVFNIRRAQVDRERIDIDIEEIRRRLHSPLLRRSVRRRLELDLVAKDVDAKDVDLARLGAVREAETLYAITKQIERQANDGQPFTYEQLQAGEAEYWQLRLSRQAYLAARGAIDPGNGDAILQTMTEPGEVRPQLLPPDHLHAMLGVDPAPVQIPEGASV